MYYMDEARRLYGQYLNQMDKRSVNPFQKLFGIRSGAGEDACHAQFIAAVEELLSRPDEIPAEERGPLAELVVHMPEEYTDDRVAYWALLAAQKAVLPVIPLLREEERRTLCDWYRRTYPKGKQLPFQKTLLAALEK